MKTKIPTPYGTEVGREFIGDIYTGSTSEVVTLTVQEEKIEAQYTPTPLPTEYWERPIHSMNREYWYSLGGNWLGLASTSFGYSGMYSKTGNFNPYTTAPNTAHVVWTKPIAFGGQIGGEFGAGDLQIYATGTAYEAKFNAVIINGILYYTEIPGAATNIGDLKAVDIRTGETLWTQQMKSDHDTLKVGMVYNFITGDQYGAHAYLFTANNDHKGFILNIQEPARWSMYEAMTGDWILDIANISAGVLTTGPNGELLSYTKTSDGMLQLWNASKCIQEGSWDQFYLIYTPLEVWRPPQGATIDWNGGIEWSIPIDPKLSRSTVSVATVSDGVVLLMASEGGALTGVPGGAQTGWRVDAGYDATTGALLWGPINRTLTPWTTVIAERGNAGEGIYVEYTMQTMTLNAYDITTGDKLWGPTEPKNSVWGYYDFTHPSVIGYGNVYSWGMGGEVYCYDARTGEEKWMWSPGSAGIDTPYGVWPLGTWSNHHILADGKLYLRAGHDYTPPVFKGAKLYCIDAFTGTEIWSSLSFDIVSSPAIADGHMLWFNGYDNQIYSYSKGPSATVVSASPKVSVHGNGVLIEGMVTDESPGTKETLLTTRFPNGVPAISDEHQSEWMEYLYQQQPMPTDAKGVEVTLDTIDPNGNWIHIGRVSSDMSGFYSYMWTPDIEGKYTIIATFEGSESYWASYAETAIGVGPAVSPAGPIEPEPSAPLISTEVAIIAAVAVAVVIGIAAFWALKKRK